MTSPTGSTITLSIDKTSVPIGGTATLTAVVTESSGTAPQNGTMVTFSAPFGTISPQEAATIGGIARATFTGTTSGTAKVSAFSGAAKATEVELKVGGAAAERITVRTEPATIPQAGGTVTVIANVQDIGGAALPNTPVNFSVDHGTLSSNAGITDANGEARIQLNTTRASKVTANVGGKTSDFTVAIVSAPTVAITSTTTTPAVGVAVTFSVTPTSPTGGAPIQNVSVNFGDGNTRNLGNITGQTAVVNTFTSPGVYTVVATATDATGQTGTGSIAINVQRLVPTVTITGLPATATAGATVSGTVTATAAPGGPALQNVQVTQGGNVVYSGTGGGGFSRSLGAAGTYTFQATATDTAGTQATTTAIVVVSGATAPAVTFAQTGTPATISNGTGTFSVSATVATGATLQSIVVRRADGTVIYSNTSGSSSFVVENLTVGQVLTATATDSLGANGTAQVIVK